MQRSLVFPFEPAKESHPQRRAEIQKQASSGSVCLDRNTQANGDIDIDIDIDGDADIGADVGDGDGDREMLRLQAVQDKDRDLLWNINQKYLVEMTDFYADRMDQEGNYHYGHFEDYFTDPKREAYFIYHDSVLVGFAMLCPYSNIGQKPDYSMAEFTIFPSFRRNHFAFDAAAMILDRHPGKWEIKYNEKNHGAKKLWHMVSAPYKPALYHLNESERVLSFVLPEDSGMQLELSDHEWPFEYTDHERTIARAVVFDEEGWLYFVRAERDDEFGKCTLIETSGGGVETGEDLQAAVRRELREELGAEVEVIEKIGFVSDYYNLIHRHNLNHYYLCRVRSFGQKKLTEDEREDFHLSTLKLSCQEAEVLYEKQKTNRLGRLISNRELPILRKAKELIENAIRDADTH